MPKLRHHTREQVLAALWSCDYHSHVLHELAVYEQQGLLSKCAELLDITPASTWLKRGLATQTNTERRSARDLRMILSWCAEATHARNQSIIPFSMAARSVARVGRRMPGRYGTMGMAWVWAWAWAWARAWEELC